MYTVSEIPKALRQAVRERDGNRCCVCFIAESTDFHHRQRRREGGHTIPNALMMCRSCHSRVHNQPKWARENGWIVSVSDDPAVIPVKYQGRFVVLDHHGNVTPWVLGGQGLE